VFAYVLVMLMTAMLSCSAMPWHNSWLTVRVAHAGSAVATAASSLRGSDPSTPTSLWEASQPLVRSNPLFSRSRLRHVRRPASAHAHDRSLSCSTAGVLRHWHQPLCFH
jgi:hypothetical protein